MSNINTVRKDSKNLPIFLFHQGTNFKAYDFLGAHFLDKESVVFRVWAPNADSVSVVGDFNNWNSNVDKCKRISKSGIFECVITGVKSFDNYKYSISNNGKTYLKADPYAFHAETPSGTASKIYDLTKYVWEDGEYQKRKDKPYDKPMNIYEVNLCSFARHKDNGYYTYREYADYLVRYVVDMGYTHIELMPVSEYPYDGSWGYQVTGYYAITSRFGTPDDFRYFVDCCHKNNIGVIIDWVPAHFPKDEHGLYEFDGSYCYENQGWDRKEHKSWGTRIFDLGRNEVQCFLISNALFLFREFHVDGLRVDAVASMLYLDYDRKPGEWIPNENGGNYNLQAIAFLRKLNIEIFREFPNALMIAEESTAFPLITKPVDVGGLGFNFKWNMGWMNDTLSYMQTDPFFRSGAHNKLTFSMYYAFSENFILPISHDEVVHGKKSLIDKMYGSIEDKFAELKAYNMYMYSHPGKKLTFMGNEFGQFREWDYQSGLEFFMLEYPNHKKLLKFNQKLNFCYKTTSPLFEIEDSWDGFNWISADEKDNNIVSYKRFDKSGNELIAIMNFSGNNFSSYRLGLDNGEYTIILCSDDKVFGGSGMITKKTYKTSKKHAHGKEYSINIKLPKFTGLYLIKK